MKPSKVNFVKQQYFDTDEAIEPDQIQAISSYGANTELSISDLPASQYEEYVFNLNGSGFLAYLQLDVFVDATGITHDMRHSIILDGVVLDSAYYRGVTGFEFNISKDYTKDRIFVRSGVLKVVIQSYGVNIIQVLANGNASLIG